MTTTATIRDRADELLALEGTTRAWLIRLAHKRGVSLPADTTRAAAARAVAEAEASLGMLP